MKIPYKLTSNTHEAECINQIIDYLASVTPKSSATVRVTHGIHGTFSEAAPPSTGGSGITWASAGRIYDKTKSYKGNAKIGELAWIKPGDALVTTGTTDPDSGMTVFAEPGAYLCLQNVSPVVNPSGLPAGTYYRIPQPNLPSGDGDIENASNYWLWIAPVANCIG
jgi:hypothetical protein